MNEEEQKYFDSIKNDDKLSGIAKLSKWQNSKYYKSPEQRFKEVDAKACNKEINSAVWGNPHNIDSWFCSLDKGHKGQHRR